jgi:PAS domain S-box-containing protein
VHLFSTTHLRTRLLLIALVAVLPAVAVLVYSQSAERDLAWRTIREDNLRVVQAAAAQEGSVFSGARRLLLTLARFPGIRGADPATCATLLPSVLRDHPDYVNLVVVRADGSLFCAARPTDARVSLGTRTWFQRALAARTTTVGDYQISATTGQPDIVVAQPLLTSSGSVDRVLAAAVRLRELRDVLGPTHLPEGGVLTFFDRTHTIVARFPDAPDVVGTTLPDALIHARMAQAGTRELAEVTGVDGVRRLEVTVPIRAEVDTNLFVTLGLNRAIASAALNRSLRNHLVLLLTVALASMLAAAFGAEVFVLRPARGLAGVIDRLAGGDFSTRAQLAAGVPGFGELAGSLNAMAAALDIRQHERDHAEAQLRESEDTYRHLFEKNPHPMWLHDAESLQFLAVNRAAIDQYGYTREEFLAMTVRDLHEPGNRPSSRAAAHGTAQYRATARHRTKDGRTLDVDVRGTLVTWRRRIVRLVLVDDITNRRHLEDQLRQSQRMEAVGQLAGGIAHDFNNLLTVINGYAELLEGTVAQSEGPLVAEISRAALRAAELTQQLLAFSRRQRLEPRVLHVSDVLGELAPMLRRLIGESIDLRTVATEKGNVKTDPGQLQQVIMNLAINARDAMKNGGRLTIETADVVLDAAYVARRGVVEPGQYVMLAVTDTGHGMDAATADRVFEPFFTTKPKGQGTGLGLSTAYGIVKQSGGYVWVYSEEGRGTTFKIYLPRTTEALESPQPPGPDPRAFGGSETILLVEDEGALRALAARVLAHAGYIVHSMGDPAAAARFVHEHTSPIDLLVTDVVMPGMSGCALADELRSMQPQAQVMFMSGYTDNALAHQGLVAAGTPFLQKPFRPDALMRKVRETLDQRGRRIGAKTERRG